MRNIMTYNGKSNMDYGIVITEMPSIPNPQERGEAIEIPGRSGTIWRSDKSFAQIEFPVRFWVPPNATLRDNNMQTVRWWLSGAGDLAFDDTLYSREFWHYKARVMDLAIVPRNFRYGWDGTANFACDPYLYRDDNEIVRCWNPSSAHPNPASLENPYPNDCLPIIHVHCTGPFSVSIGSHRITLDGSYQVTGEVIIDSAAKRVYRKATGFDLTRFASGEFPTIEGSVRNFIDGVPTPNLVRWSGSVSTATDWSVVNVLPNWRMLPVVPSWASDEGTYGDAGIFDEVSGIV